MAQDFTKGKIYKITNDFNDDVYIGSTCDKLVKRFIKHKADAQNEKCKNRPLYKLINEVGFERFRIQLIEDFPCNDKYELRQREGHFIRQLGTLNKKIEGRTVKEYYKDNKEKIKETKKEYYDKNKEKYQIILNNIRKTIKTKLKKELKNIMMNIIKIIKKKSKITMKKIKKKYQKEWQ